MAKLLLVCFRNKNKSLTPDSFNFIARQLVPDNIEPRACELSSMAGIQTCVINPNSTVLTHRGSACLGYMARPRNNWWQPQAEKPDGSFALFRADDEFVELVSDTCGSRTIWYFKSDEILIASTSQRAIVMLLQDYQPGSGATMWMLSAGNIGPGFSWDRRIRCLKENGRLLFNRQSWTWTEHHHPVQFKPAHAPDHIHEENLRAALAESCSLIDLDPNKWQILLSGGIDSRCILMLLKNRQGLKSATWGLRAALDNSKSDAAIAKALADHYGLQHTYYETDMADEDLHKVFERLLIAGEGRTDTISAYMDACEIWRRLFASGIGGIIRGDIVFSPISVYNSEDVRRADGVMMLSDYRNLAAFASDFAEQQCLPEYMMKGNDESYPGWRDRLTYQYRSPVIWAALNEIKSAYVEIMNPLLSRRIVETIATLPDHLRNNRILYKKLVYSMSPAIGFADDVAIGSTAVITKTPTVVNHMIETLTTREARDLFPAELLSMTLRGLKIAEPGCASPPPKRLAAIKRLMPNRLRALKQRWATPKDIDLNLLALRATVIVKMHEMLQKDAALLKNSTLQI